MADFDRFEFSRQLLGRRNLSCGTKVVGQVLVNFSDQSGFCWPSVERIAADAGLKRRAAIGALRQLESHGLISTGPPTGSVRKRLMKDGHQANRLPNRYRLRVQADAPQQTCTTVHPKTVRGARIDKLGVHERAPRIDHMNRPEESPNGLSASRNGLWDSIVAEWFADGVASSQKTRVGRLVKQFAELGASPEEIAARRKRLLGLWGGKTDTPESLLKHWSKFRHGNEDNRPGRVTARPGKYDALKVVRA